MFVKKPMRTSEGWRVVVRETANPKSSVIEVIKCSSREDAWQIYRCIQKERGVGL